MTLQSAFKNMAIHRRNEAYKAWNEYALETLKTGKSIRVPTKVAKHILLYYPTIDDKYRTCVRNIGAGVKELYTKEV